ncbi:Hypothetical protein SCF082_LOCUS17140 [Durusdinium trenchii]|uniref:DUF4042 domain-containing protein n=1 Tax=Durusdinium trenchii TaxID=1381693 RepID=A0ABP0KFH0_9DINO
MPCTQLQEWHARSESRAEELVAIQETLKLLADDEDDPRVQQRALELRDRMRAPETEDEVSPGPLFQSTRGVTRDRTPRVHDRATPWGCGMRLSQGDDETGTETFSLRLDDGGELWAERSRSPVKRSTLSCTRNGHTEYLEKAFRSILNGIPVATDVASQFFGDRKVLTKADRARIQDGPRLDWFCVPQILEEVEELSMDDSMTWTKEQREEPGSCCGDCGSIPLFVEACEIFVVLVPAPRPTADPPPVVLKSASVGFPEAAYHTTTQWPGVRNGGGQRANFSSWLSRGWCRCDLGDLALTARALELVFGFFGDPDQESTDPFFDGTVDQLGPDQRSTVDQLGLSSEQFVRFCEQLRKLPSTAPGPGAELSARLAQRVANALEEVEHKTETAPRAAGKMKGHGLFAEARVHGGHGGLAEEKSSMGSAELAAAVLAALQLCSEVVLQRSSRAMLREAVQLLQALPQVLEVTGDTLEASALTALAHLQPLAVLGAPYVLPRRTAAEVSGRAEVSSSVSWSETEPQSAAERKGKGRGEGKDAVTALQTLQAQCRSLSLRNFAQLFKLWPKAFFGRWPLVLDFQSGEVCRPGSGIQRPMLLSICDRDPVVRVRQQALSALVALLQAPQLKAWPVPLETSQKAQSSTSLTGQLAMTIRQSHALVMELMDGDELNQLNALRACADLVASTPYSKLQSGLITSLLDKLLAFAYQSELKLEASPPVLALVLALSSLLKREDCAAEITKALFRTRRPSGPSAVAACAGEASADWLFQQMLRLMTETPEMKPQTPTGARRTDGRKDRGKRPETPEEPLMIQEFALLTGRLALFVPAALPESTLTLLEQLVLSFVSQQSSMLRLRAFRLLNDLPLSEAWQFSPSFLEQLFQISQRPEPIASVRQSLLSALPGLVRCSARSELTEEHPLRQVLRQGLQDVNGGVRTAAAQALGAMASRFELDAVQWLIPLAADPTGDVRSASATALASFAPRLGEGPLRTEVAEVLLPLCSDASDKARASGLRAVGCLAEGFAEMPRSLAESLAKLLMPGHRELVWRGVEMCGHSNRTAAVAQPPPKCQWNACRSAGQLAVCASHLPQARQRGD